MPQRLRDSGNTDSGIFNRLSSESTSGCASHYLDCIRRIRKVSSSRRLGYQEEMMRLLVDTSKHQNGSKNDPVIKYQRALGDFYTNMVCVVLQSIVFLLVVAEGSQYVFSL